MTLDVDSNRRTGETSISVAPGHDGCSIGWVPVLWLWDKKGIQWSQSASLLEADFWGLYIADFTVCSSLSKGIRCFFLPLHQVLILDIIYCISTKLSLLLLDSEDIVAFSWLYFQYLHKCLAHRRSQVKIFVSWDIWISLIMWPK